MLQCIYHAIWKGYARHCETVRIFGIKDGDVYNPFTTKILSYIPYLTGFDRSCTALYGLNHLGPEGYHWRVCVEDKAAPGSSDTACKTFSWWDIQDENASLPIKEASSQQLHKFFSAPMHALQSDNSTSVAKGAFKTLGKAVSQAVSGSTDMGEGASPLKVVAFKLLDLVKMHDDFATKHKGRNSGGHIPQPAVTPPLYQQKVPVKRPPVSRQPPPQQNLRASAPPASAQPPQQNRAVPRQQTESKPQAETSLMDFGPGPASGPNTGGLRHSSSMPVHASSETRAEKLKREYAQKNMSAQRVWDDIDQRWVEVDSEKKTSVGNNEKSSSLLGGIDVVEKKIVGVSLDPANAVGKSSTVQAAVNNRVNEMRESQAKALLEVREREERKKKEEAEEDEVRRRLEPTIKQWSEEHGKKKQLRALLASLHTILWPGAQWKQVTIGDLLDDKKVKLAFHKASRVVHPDKTHHLEAEQRFLAKRIFDALSQAKNEFDGSK
jgi:hypothetical protein